MKTHVILGASSAVAFAFARETLAESKVAVRFVLIGRNERRLEQIRADLVARGADRSTAVLTAALGDPKRVRAAKHELETINSGYDIDQVLLAYGILGEQRDLHQDIEKIEELLDVNFVSAAMWCEAFAEVFQKQDHGHLVVIGSVAGDRGRQSNYLYGAGKAGLERVCEGLSHRFAASRTINVTIVKPGFIDTPMTAHLEKSGPLWTTPSRVARDILNAVDTKRVRIYSPWFWRYILIIVRMMPVPFFHKTKL